MLRTSCIPNRRTDGPHSGPHLGPRLRLRPEVPLLLATTLATLLLPPVVSASSLDAEVEITAYEDARDPAPALLAFLQDEDPDTRGRAALALGRIGRPEDVARLAALLEDGAVEVRRNAAFALGEVEDSTASFPLEELLLSGFEKDPEVRELAIYGLGKLGRGAEACRAALHDGAESVQARALLSAWRIPGSTDTEEMLQFSRHKRIEVRWCAAYCLMRLLGAPPSGRTPIPEGTGLTADERDRIAARLLILTEEEDPRVVLQAIRGLRTRREGEVTARVQALLSHQDWRVRVEALRTLAATLPLPEPEDGVAPLPDRREVALDTLRPLLEDPNPNVVATLLEALARIGGDEAEELLYAQLSNPAPRQRELALASLATRLRERRVQEERAASPEGSAADRDRFFAAIAPLLADPVWSVTAACVEVGDLLPEDRQGDFYLALTRQEGRIAKVAVGPYLEWRDAHTEGWPSLAEFQPELGEFLLSEDPMVVLMTLNGLDEAYRRAAETDEADADGGSEAAPDWSALAQLLEKERARALADPLWNDVRQAIVGIAGPRAEIPEMEAILVRSAIDPSYLVRRDAIEALEGAGRAAPRAAGPVETRYSKEELRAILEWSRQDHRAVFETAAGTFEARLFTRDAPLTCWNFSQLAESGFYDDGSWHRVVPDFVLQDGCPRGDGWGGPPDQIRCEINRRRYGRGALGMALSGKDTGGSQFFFTHSEQPHLDGGYTVFGELVKGRPIADLVSQGDPITRIRVVQE